MGRRTSVTISAAGDFAAREERRAQVNYVSEEYFETIGLRLVEGRAFEAGDRHGAPVVVVAEVFARQQFPGSSAVGRALRIGSDQTERTIVGVVSNVLLDGIRRQPSPIVYVPASARSAAADDDGNTGIGLLVRFTPGARVLRDMQRAPAPSPSIDCWAALCSVFLVNVRWPSSSPPSPSLPPRSPRASRPACARCGSIRRPVLRYE